MKQKNSRVQTRSYLIQVGVEAGYQKGVNKTHKKVQVEELYRFAEQAAGLQE